MKGITASAPHADLAEVNRAFVHAHVFEGWDSFAEVPPYSPASSIYRRTAEELGLTSESVGRSTAFFAGETCIGGITGIRPSSVSTFGAGVASSKRDTKRLLAAAGVPTPEGYAVSPAEAQELAQELAPSSDNRYVVKPSKGSQGEGITTGISSGELLESAISRASAANAGKRLIIEEEVPGLDLRVFVVGGRAAAAAVRLPPFVVGDGASSLEALVERLRAARSEHGYLQRLKLSPDVEHLRHNGADLGSVPGSSEVVFLNGTANLSRGGLGVDVTDSVSPDLLSLAEKASLAVPGLSTCGVDVLAPSLDASVGAKVIELNTSANPLVHEMPAFGKPRRVIRSVLQTMAEERGINLSD